MRVEIYSKPNCGLCDAAKAVLAEARAHAEFTLEEVDITTDPALFERHRYDIPVVFIDGHKAFKHRVELEVFLERLKRAQGTPG